jgi:hypothetical protein
VNSAATQGDQVGGALARLDRGKARDAEHVALSCRAALDQVEGGGCHADVALRARQPGGFGLGADIDHMGLAGGIEVGQRRGARLGRWFAGWIHEIP